MLKVVTPAADLALVDIERLRLAAGLAANDASRDAELGPLGLRLSADIVQACRVATGNGAEPTLRQETLEETFRYPRTSALMLSRRHKVEIVSITINGQLLDAELYWVDEESGIVRLVSGFWWGGLIVVTYKAGFEEVPDDLAGTVADFARIRLSEGSRDPLVRGQSTEVPGVLTERTDYWVGSVPGQKVGGIPGSILAQLRRYKNLAMV